MSADGPKSGGSSSGVIKSADASKSPVAIDTFDRPLRFEELVERAALEDLCKSVYALFGIPVRVFSSEGTIVADAAGQQEICAYVGTTIAGRHACATTVSAAKAKDPGDAEEVDHPCFTGASYRVVAIDYEGRRIGRMVIGPYVYHTVMEPPPSLLATVPTLERERSRELLGQMPRVKPDTIGRIARHMRTTLDLILWSGHKQMMTTQLHLASVKESYRELQEKNAKLQETYDRLKELDRLKSNFLATVSHELRTPLTSIIGYSEMLTEGIAGPLAAEQQDFVATIHEKGEQLLGLIMSLLDLSKLESGTMSMRRRPARIEQVLREAMSTVLPVARRKNVELVVAADDGLPEVRVDPERIRQVVLNLMDNAVKFTPTGGKVRISARALAGGLSDQAPEEGFSLLGATPAAVEIRVTDTGVGVPEHEGARIFDAFYQVDSSSTREHGGAGLGLAIVKRILEAHGGAVRVEAPSDGGAAFVVVLPLGDEPFASA